MNRSVAGDNVSLLFHRRRFAEYVVNAKSLVSAIGLVADRPGTALAKRVEREELEEALFSCLMAANSSIRSRSFPRRAQGGDGKR
jgi:hypothetical protein